jgi:prepilin-type N-terminal cleavage/methylation domain-containing protein
VLYLAKTSAPTKILSGYVPLGSGHLNGGLYGLKGYGQFGHQRGFSLIEIMVVVVIMGILAALVVPNLLDRPDQARVVARPPRYRQPDSDVEALPSGQRPLPLD